DSIQIESEVAVSDEVNLQLETEVSVKRPDGTILILETTNFQPISAQISSQLSLDSVGEWQVITTVNSIDNEEVKTVLESATETLIVHDLEALVRELFYDYRMAYGTSTQD